MPLGEQPHQHPLYEPVLTDDHPLDLEDRAFQQLGIPRRGGTAPGMLRGSLDEAWLGEAGFGEAGFGEAGFGHGSSSRERLTPSPARRYTARPSDAANPPAGVTTVKIAARHLKSQR